MNTCVKSEMIIHLFYLTLNIHVFDSTKKVYHDIQLKMVKQRNSPVKTTQKWNIEETSLE